MKVKNVMMMIWIVQKRISPFWTNSFGTTKYKRVVPTEEVLDQNSHKKSTPWLIFAEFGLCSR